MLSLMGFLALHVSLVLGNTSTIEAFEKTKAGNKWRYDMGRQRNIEQVRRIGSTQAPNSVLLGSLHSALLWKQVPS